MDTHCAEITTALPNKLCSGSHKATEEEGDHGIFGDLESEIETAGFKYSWRKMEAMAKRQNWIEQSGL